MNDEGEESNELKSGVSNYNNNNMGEGLNVNYGQKETEDKSQPATAAC